MEERSHCRQCSFQVDSMVVEMCLWGNRMCFQIPVPIRSSCVTSSTIPGSELWRACQQCQLFYGVT